MGFQFCGFCRRCEQINQFTTVRSNQMTSRSGQEREPPRFVDFGFIACRFGFFQKESNDVSRIAVEGKKTSNLGSKTRNLIFKVYTNELLLLRYATAMPPVSFYCTVS
jgi:hypothetical protein